MPYHNFVAYKKHLVPIFKVCKGINIFKNRRLSETFVFLIESGSSLEINLIAEAQISKGSKEKVISGFNEISKKKG